MRTLVTLAAVAFTACTYRALEIATSTAKADAVCEGDACDGQPVCESGQHLESNACVTNASGCTCAPCNSGESYPAPGSSCCGFECIACEAPADPSFTECAGTLEERTDQNGCAL